MSDRERIMAEARAHLERLADLQPREAPIERLRRSEPIETKPEPVELSYKATDAQRAAATSAAWCEFVRSEIRTATLGSAGAIVETVMEVLADRDRDIQDALDRRDQRIARLETQLSKLEVALAQNEVKLCQALVDLDRSRHADAPPTSSRRELN
jgi:hypothetical protein